MPTSKTKARQGRVSATTIKELHAHRRRDNKSFRTKVTQALAGRLGSCEQDGKVLACLMGKQDRLSEPIMSDLGVRTKLGQLLARANLAKMTSAPETEFYHVTILDRRWDTSLERTIIDVHRVQSDTRYLLNSLFPHWVSVIESHPFANVNHETGGKLLTVHVHAIGFGSSDRSHLDHQVRDACHRLQSRFPATEPIRVNRIRPTKLDLCRATEYPWKPPHRSKTLYLNHEKGKANLHESEANDRFIRYLRMAQILSVCRPERFVYAGGQGGAIRSDALREAKSWLATGLKDRNPPIHSEAIPHYWDELWERLGERRFKPPLIKCKKH